MLGPLAQLLLRTFKAKRASNKPRISDLTERYCETLVSLLPLPEAAVWPIFVFQSSNDSVAEGPLLHLSAWPLLLYCALDHRLTQ